MSALPIRLSDLQVGALARFHEARLDTTSRDLLRALGMIESCQLRLCKAGSPCIVQVRSTRIGLSKAVARGIYVIPQAHDAA